MALEALKGDSLLRREQTNDENKILNPKNFGNGAKIPASVDVNRVINFFSGYKRPELESGDVEVISYLALTQDTYQTIRTTTAGKKFYMTKLIIAGDGLTAGNVLFIANSGTAKMVISCSSANFNYSLDFPIPMVFDAGETVQAKLTTGESTCYISIMGFEE